MTSSKELLNNRGQRVLLYDRHMPEIDDVTLLVLKGHLLVEEVLFALAGTVFPNPQYLPRFTFHNLACVVRAVIPLRADDPCWEMILKLNSLRNDLAHNLESAKRYARIAELFHIHDQVEPTPSIQVDKHEESTLSDSERLRLIIQDSMKFLLSLDFDIQTKPLANADESANG